MASSFHSLGWHPETWTFQCLRTPLRNQGLHLQPGKKSFFIVHLASVTVPYLSFFSDWSSFLLPLPQGRRGGPHHTGRGGPGGVSHISSYTLYLEISTFKY